MDDPRVTRGLTYLAAPLSSTSSAVVLARTIGVLVSGGHRRPDGDDRLRIALIYRAKPVINFVRPTYAAPRITGHPAHRRTELAVPAGDGHRSRRGPRSRRLREFVIIRRFSKPSPDPPLS